VLSTSAQICALMRIRVCLCDHICVYMCAPIRTETLIQGHSREWTEPVNTQIRARIYAHLFVHMHANTHGRMCTAKRAARSADGSMYSSRLRRNDKHKRASIFIVSLTRTYKRTQRYSRIRNMKTLTYSCILATQA
jgi:hypothetical protein